MRKNRKHLHGGLRGFAAAAAIASLAAFGCSTNRTPGDGQPGMTAPSSPAATPGTSSGTNPPMASAAEIGASITRANDAAAIAASHQRERFLGVINPSGAQTTAAVPPSNQVVPPSAYANPQYTVNASISSDAIPVITSGAGSADGGIFLGSATTGATAGTSTGTTAAATIGATTGTATGSTTNSSSAAATINNSALATPATAAITATPGQFAAGPTGTSTVTTGTTAATNTAVLTPTLTSGVTPSPTRAANPTIGSLRVNQPTTKIPATTTTASSTTTSTTSTSARGRVVVAPIRVLTNANGTVTVTNVNPTPPTVIKATGKQ
jgi:hypothetical protein